MKDEKVISNCRNSKFAETFEKLYKGKGIYETDQENVYALALRLSVFSEDINQLYRVISKSGYAGVILNIDNKIMNPWKSLIAGAFAKTEDMRVNKEKLLITNDNK